MPIPPPDPMDGMGLGVEHLLEMSPGTSGVPNASPPGSLATPGAAVTDLLLNGHPSGLPLGTFAAVALPLAPPSPCVRGGAVHRIGIKRPRADLDHRPQTYPCYPPARG